MRKLTAGLLLASTCLAAPAAGQSTDAGAPAGAGSTPTVQTPQDDAAAQAQQAEDVDISIPGADAGDIVVTGRADRNIVEQAPQVISVLSSADIARTGEGDIAGALQRVTGLSVVGSGLVYVRGLGDRYSLALLNGLPLPSPEPLRRVVPLDIFPTDVIASSLVQKSYSVNFPGEFGGGVINLTTKTVSDDPFLNIGMSVSGDTETTGQLGYTYYGSPTDWSGFDNGTRDVPGPLAAALNSGRPILAGADFSNAQLTELATTLVNARTTLLQRNDTIPANFSGDVSGGYSWDVGEVRLGVLAAAGLSNKWRTRQTLQQLSLNADLSGVPQTSFDRVITDNRSVANGLLSIAAEFGENKIRWTNLYIRDTLKQSRLAAGNDQNQANRDLLKQDTAWYERQLIDTQLVGEFEIGDVDLDLRGSYANTQREAPYERTFTYVRTNAPGDPTGRRFVNDLGGNKGDATIAFSDLNEDLWAGGVDVGYKITPEVRFGAGYAYSDTNRTTVRREFQYRATNLPLAVQQLRPDYLLSDFTIRQYGIRLLETSAQAGTAAFDAGLKVHAGYAQFDADLLDNLKVNAGVRYETAKQNVNTVDLFGTGAATQFNTALDEDYWLPGVTATLDVAERMQVRLSVSKTIARPQFRELIRQVYIDTDSNRVFQGNPSLVDSQLKNIEGRWEWFFARDQRVTAAAFWKEIRNPIEAYSSINSSEITTSFANAPKASLYGVEIEAQKYIDLDQMGGDFFANRRLALIGNYTYTKSELSVGAGDRTVVNGVTLPSNIFFKDGAPLTGQSDHLVNVQIGLEDTDKLSQQTFLLSYASDRVTTRGPSGQPDVYESPGFRLDFVAREALNFFGVESELKLEVRNITNRGYREFQKAGTNRIFFNRYDLGTSLALGLGLKF